MHRRPRSSRPIQTLIGTCVWLTGQPFVGAYRVAEWIFDLKKRGAARNLARLIEEVEAECSYLFRRFGARILPELSSGSPSMDFAIVVIELRSLQLRATRDRGTTDWEITSPTSQLRWLPLAVLCKRVAPDGKPAASAFRLLADNLEKIEQLFVNNSPLLSNPVLRGE